MIPQEHYVDVSGRTLFALEAGSGSPTIVFEAGLGDFSRTWHNIQVKIAESAQTISYDRAGRGQSQFVGEGRTLHECLDDLRSLLAALDAPPPYILVGHSFGGFVARMFAYRYPAEVAGLVFVDSAQEDAIFRFRDILKNGTLPPRRFDEPIWLTYERFHQTQHADPRFSRNVLLNEEGVDLMACYEQIRGVLSLGAKPLTVITGAKRDWERKNGAEGLVAEWEVVAEKAWNDCQIKLLGLSTGATQVVAQGSGNYVQDDQPEVVVAAIRDVLERIREGVSAD